MSLLAPLTRIFPVAALAVTLAFAAPARAVIKVGLPVSKIYDTSKSVLVGTVTKVNPDNHVVEVRTAETAKGAAGPEQFRIQIAQPPDFLKQVAVGQPVVVFVGRQAVVHVADAWLIADAVPNVQPPAWRVLQAKDDYKRNAFPGTTAALVRVVAELKAGKSTLLDEVKVQPFAGGAAQVAKLDVAHPTFVVAADVNGDRKPDLIVGTAGGGVRLFLATGDSYADATAAWGLTAVTSATAAAAGDVNGDGKVDLLLGGMLWINDGQKFTPAKSTLSLPDAAQPLAVALIDANGDKRPDALVLLRDGTLLTFDNPGAGAPDHPWPAHGPPRRLVPAGATPTAAAFGDWAGDGSASVLVVQEDGITRYPVDVAGGAPADFERLTGEKLAAIKPLAGGLKGATIAAVEANGDHRSDLLVVAGDGSVLLANRGFGAFLADADAGGELVGKGEKPLPFKVTAATPWAAADRRGDGHDDLLVLAEDGRLFVVSNPSATK